MVLGYKRKDLTAEERQVHAEERKVRGLFLEKNIEDIRLKRIGSKILPHLVSSKDAEEE